MVAQACEVRRVAVQTVVASRVSVYPSVPVSQPASATASSARVRPLIGLGTSSGALQTSGPVPLEAQADEAAKQVKLHWMPSSTSSLSMSSTLRVGYRSIDQASLNDPPLATPTSPRHHTARSCSAVYGSVGVAALGAGLGPATRLPKPFQLASFLHSVSRGGHLQLLLCMRP